MEVIATKKGYYGSVLRRKGDKFILTHNLNLDSKPTKAEIDENINKQFSKSWMEKVAKKQPTKTARKIKIK